MPPELVQDSGEIPSAYLQLAVAASSHFSPKLQNFLSNSWPHAKKHRGLEEQKFCLEISSVRRGHQRFAVILCQCVDLFVLHRHHQNGAGGGQVLVSTQGRESARPESVHIRVLREPGNASEPK